MEVVVRTSFFKDAKKCPGYIQGKLNEVLHALEEAENLQTSGLDYTKCKGSRKGEKYYRIRIGDWRMGVELKHPAVIVITIMTRGQIYNKFPPT